MANVEGADGEIGSAQGLAASQPQTDLEHLKRVKRHTSAKVKS